MWDNLKILFQVGAGSWLAGADHRQDRIVRALLGGGGGGKSEIDGTAEQLKAALAAQVATVKSPSKLEQEQTFLIAKKLQELTGSKNIKLKPVIDESLIAGFVVEYGSSQIDLSVKGQLDKISQELENASFAF